MANAIDTAASVRWTATNPTLWPPARIPSDRMAQTPIVQIASERTMLGRQVVRWYTACPTARARPVKLKASRVRPTSRRR